VAFNRTAFRIKALNRLFAYRYGGPDGFYVLPDDDSGRHDLQILASYYAAVRPTHVWLIVKAKAPWSSGDVELLPGCIYWTDDQLGAELGLTAAVRDLLKIRCIGAIDQTQEQRDEVNRMRDIELKRNKRKTRRKQSRQTYEANSISQSKPWVALGISRATYYRNGERPPATPATARVTVIEIGVEDVRQVRPLPSQPMTQVRRLPRASMRQVWPWPNRPPRQSVCCKFAPNKP
jgi:hypothetical protein